MKIMILSTSIQKWGNIDALRKEAFMLYKLLLHENTDADILLVSIENDLKECDSTNEVIITTSEKLHELIDNLNPDVIHIVEATPYLLYDLLQFRNYSPCKVVATLIDNDPLEPLTEKMIEEIVHISDHNEIFFFCYSEHAMQVLQKAGIRNVLVTMPLVDTHLLLNGLTDNYEEKSFPTDIFTVGFASTPFTEDSMVARGINLLEKAISQTETNVKFRVPWREASVAPPDQFLSNNKVDITYGFINMQNFYKNIDIYLLPFAEYGQNHACPHSFWEALAYGKPLVVTDRAGIAALVKKYEIGVVCGPEPEELAKAIHNVINNYQKYCKRISLLREEILADVLDQPKIIQKYIEIYKNLLNDPSFVMTLSSWRELLGSKGGGLVKGISAMKEYYSEQAEAVIYREKRFQQFPMNVYNHMERQAIKLVLEAHQSKCSGQLELLDIAAGDGRISEVLYEYGNTTLIENSANMLQIIMDALKTNPNHYSISMINDDFLNMDNDIYVNHFDIATTFRFIRHFEYQQRCNIYAKISKLLKTDGLLIFDVPNKYTEVMLRNKLGWDQFNIYDVFWTKESIDKELKLNGFELRNLISVGQYCFRDTLMMEFALPMSWVAVAKKCDN